VIGDEEMIIENVDLVPEHNSYKIDASGRIIIPAHMRNKFRVDSGDFMEYFTAYVDGDRFLCCRKDEERSRIEREKEAAKKKKK
jgi:bifunctional DNA-binding transcriptional regulator/antitoxin component of YhaV-PrlF toxin-antitoxin module